MVPSQFQARRSSATTPPRSPARSSSIPRRHFLYYVLGNGQAIRYGIGVGRTGFGWHGTVRVGSKARMAGLDAADGNDRRARRKRGHKLPDIHEGRRRTIRSARARSTSTARAATPATASTAPASRGRSASTSRRAASASVNDDVIDLYNRAKVGAKVIVL